MTETDKATTETTVQTVKYRHPVLAAEFALRSTDSATLAAQPSMQPTAQPSGIIQPAATAVLQPADHDGSQAVGRLKRPVDHGRPAILSEWADESKRLSSSGTRLVTEKRGNVFQDADPRIRNSRGDVVGVPLVYEVRKRAVDLFDENKTTKEVADQCQISVKTANKLKKDMKLQNMQKGHDGKTIGVPAPGKQGGWRWSKMNEKQITACSQIAVENPRWTTTQIREELERTFAADGLALSDSTVWRALQKSKLQFMRAIMKDPRRDDTVAHKEELAAFNREQKKGTSGMLDPKHLFFMDETIVYLNEMTNYGWGSAGKPPTLEKSKGKTKTIAVYAGLGLVPAGKTDKTNIKKLVEPRHITDVRSNGMFIDENGSWNHHDANLKFALVWWIRPPQREYERLPFYITSEDFDDPAFTLFSSTKNTFFSPVIFSHTNQEYSYNADDSVTIGGKTMKLFPYSGTTPPAQYKKIGRNDIDIVYPSDIICIEGASQSEYYYNIAIHDIKKYLEESSKIENDREIKIRLNNSNVSVFEHNESGKIIKGFGKNGQTTGNAELSSEALKARMGAFNQLLYSRFKEYLELARDSTSPHYEHIRAQLHKQTSMIPSIPIPRTYYTATGRNLKGGSLESVRGDRAMFLSYLRKVAHIYNTVFGPQVRRSLIMAWDAASAHGHVDVTANKMSFMHSWVKSQLKVRDCIFLPVRSPDYNPVELLFAYIKGRIRSRITSAAGEVTVEIMANLIDNAMGEVTEKMIMGWIQYGCYRVEGLPCGNACDDCDSGEDEDDNPVPKWLLESNTEVKPSDIMTILTILRSSETYDAKQKLLNQHFRLFDSREDENLMTHIEEKMEVSRVNIEDIKINGEAIRDTQVFHSTDIITVKYKTDKVHLYSFENVKATLKSIRDYTECSIDASDNIQLKCAIIHFDKVTAKPSGFKWEEIKQSRSLPVELHPTGEIDSLKEMLKKSPVISPKDWKSLNITDLKMENVVKSDGKYFKPMPSMHRPNCLDILNRLYFEIDPYNSLSVLSKIREAAKIAVDKTTSCSGLYWVHEPNDPGVPPLQIEDDNQFIASLREGKLEFTREEMMKFMPETYNEITKTTVFNVDGVYYVPKDPYDEELEAAFKEHIQRIEIEIPDTGLEQQQKMLEDSPYFNSVSYNLANLGTKNKTRTLCVIAIVAAQKETERCMTICKNVCKLLKKAEKRQYEDDSVKELMLSASKQFSILHRKFVATDPNQVGIIANGEKSLNEESNNMHTLASASLIDVDRYVQKYEKYKRRDNKGQRWPGYPEGADKGKKVVGDGTPLIRAIKKLWIERVGSVPIMNIILEDSETKEPLKLPLLLAPKTSQTSDESQRSIDSKWRSKIIKDKALEHLFSSYAPENILLAENAVQRFNEHGIEGKPGNNSNTRYKFRGSTSPLVLPQYMRKRCGDENSEFGMHWKRVDLSSDSVSDRDGVLATEAEKRKILLNDIFEVPYRCWNGNWTKSSVVRSKNMFFKPVEAKVWIDASVPGSPCLRSSADSSFIHSVHNPTTLKYALYEMDNHDRTTCVVDDTGNHIRMSLHDLFQKHNLELKTQHLKPLLNAKGIRLSCISSKFMLYRDSTPITDSIQNMVKVKQHSECFVEQRESKYHLYYKHPKDEIFRVTSKEKYKQFQQDSLDANLLFSFTKEEYDRVFGL